jgi:SecD/SecF fusion protein
VNDQTRRRVGLLLIISLLIVCGISLFKKQVNPETGKKEWMVNIKEGLDLQGGSQFTIQLEGEPTKKALDQAVEVIRSRIDGMGLSEPIIQPFGNNRIIVQIPGASESDKASYRRQLERVAKLEFRRVHPESQALLAQIKNKQADLPFDYEVKQVTDVDSNNQPVSSDILVEKRAALSGKNISRAFRSIDQLGRATVVIEFNSKGRKDFGELTEKMIGKQIAIMLDGEIKSSPRVNEAIYGNCQISGGNMSPQEAEELSSVLENPLENPVQIIDERGVDPSLGKSSVKSAFLAGMAGLIAVVIFTICYYRFSGLLAVIALCVNLFMLLGLLAQFGFTLTLPGIAGIILTIGMAVDSNVLIFERIREELKRGNPLDVALHSGFNKAFSSILDANVTTIIGAAVLFWLGSGPVQGFAIALTLGILTSMFSALVITRNLYDWSYKLGLAKISMTDFVGEINLDFMKYRKAGLIISLIIAVVCLYPFRPGNDNIYGVDFKGGDLLSLTFEKKIDDAEVRKALDGFEDTSIQYQKGTSNSQELLSIKAPFNEGEKIEKTLQEKFPEAKFQRSVLDKVQSLIGAEFARNSILAILLGMLGIFIYVACRFEASFAIGATVALIHDVIVAAGIYVLLGNEINLTTIAAILTIAGYSLNDTIIIFDRIREGLKNYTSTGHLIEAFNHSINVTLSRTIITSGTTFLSTLCLWLFGGVTIQGFALIILLGIAVGTYSSIFIASPVALYLLRNKKSV